MAEEPADSKPKKDKAPKAEGKKGKKVELKDEGEDFKYIVRVANSDLDGHKTVRLGVAAIPGVGKRIGHSIASDMGPAGSKRLGELTDDEVILLAEAVDGIAEKVPHWMLNRQHDYDSGHDTHLLGIEVSLQRQDDINRLKKIRCYKGVRHETGHKVRGQRTCSNGRKGMTMGVSRKKK
jgi:small subunit ribosomal protein S13